MPDLSAKLAVAFAAVAERSNCQIAREHGLSAMLVRHNVAQTTGQCARLTATSTDEDDQALAAPLAGRNTPNTLQHDIPSATARSGNDARAVVV